MNQQQYDKKCEQIQRELQQIEQTNRNCRLLKKQIALDEEEKEENISVAVQLNNNIECNWKDRNMIGNKQYLFEEEKNLLRKITSERNSLWQNDFDDLKQYIKKISWKREACQKNLLKLRQEYEEAKGEKDSGKNY